MQSALRRQAGYHVGCLFATKYVAKSVTQKTWNANPEVAAKSVAKYWQSFGLTEHQADMHLGQRLARQSPKLPKLDAVITFCCVTVGYLDFQKQLGNTIPWVFFPRTQGVAPCYWTCCCKS